MLKVHRHHTLAVRIAGMCLHLDAFGAVLFDSGHTDHQDDISDFRCGQHSVNSARANQLEWKSRELRRRQSCVVNKHLEFLRFVLQSFCL